MGYVGIMEKKYVFLPTKLATVITSCRLILVTAYSIQKNTLHGSGQDLRNSCLQAVDPFTKVTAAWTSHLKFAVEIQDYSALS